MAKKSRARRPSPKHIILEREPSESPAAWERALVEIEQGGHAVVTRQPDGSAIIAWPGAMA